MKLKTDRKCTWDESILIPCADEKARRVKPGIMPLAHGVPARVGAIKAYGNAIVPQIAAVFVRAFMDEILTVRDKKT